MKQLIIGASLVSIPLLLAGGKCQEQKAKPVEKAEIKGERHSIDEIRPKDIKIKPAESSPRHDEPTQKEDPEIEEKLSEILAEDQELRKLADVNSVVCVPSKCTVEMESTTDDVTAMQAPMMTFMLAHHQEYGDTVTFYQDDANPRVTFFIIEK